MKKIIFILLFTFTFLLSPSFCKAQNWIWGRQPKPGITGATGEGSYDHATAVDASGNAIICGTIGDTVMFGPYKLIQDTYLVKYDTAGNVVWADGFGIGIYIASVAVDARRNVYIAGGEYGTVPMGPDTLRSSDPNGLCFLAKLDSNGHILWAKQSIATGRNNFSEGLSLAVDKQGNCIIGGHFGDTVRFGNDTLKSTASYGNAFIVKYDSAGNERWARQCVQSTNVNSYGKSVAVDKWGNAFLAGNFQDSVTFGRYKLTGNAEVFIVKYDANGNLRWAEQSKPGIYFGDYASGNSVSVDYYGDAYLTGSFYQSIYWGNDTINSFSNTTAYLTKFDTAGNTIWAKAGNNLDGDAWQGQSISCDTSVNGGTFVLFNQFLGSTPPYKLAFGKDTFKLNTSRVTSDLLVHFDSAGKVVCGSIFTEGDEDDGSSVGTDNSGRYIYVYGDLYDTTIFARDTLVYGHDMTFIARWQDLTLDIAIAAHSNSIECMGTGSATANVATGGMPPYTYQWSPSGGTNLSATGLSAGTYTITVTDKNHYTASTNVTITQPPTLSITISAKTNISCFDSNTGIITAHVATGGVPPYTYQWSSGGGTNLTISGLSAGTYTITTTDANLCTATAATTISQPPPIAISFQHMLGSVCNSCASINVSGGTPSYHYLWAPAGQTTDTLCVYANATLSVVVTDSNGCRATATVTITQPTALSITANVTNSYSGNCVGSIGVDVIGGSAPYTYNWSPIHNTTDSASNLCAGYYCCLVTDANGCIDSVCAVIRTTGINNISNNDNGITIYPNPSSGIFNLVIASEAKQSYPTIEVYNVLGEKVYSQFNIHNSTFTIHNSTLICPPIPMVSTSTALFPIMEN